MEHIPFLELKSTYLELKEEIDYAVQSALNSGWYIGGDLIDKFEHDFRSYCGTDECVTVGNGLDAIQIALTAHGVGCGDKVLVPSHTFVATWLAVSLAGCIPVPVDVSSNSMLVSESDYLNSLAPDIRCVIPVLLYGETTDYSRLIRICNDRGIAVIVDAAQAHGARLSSQRMLNECAHCWSFYPGKNLGAFGDAGAITLNDSNVAIRARKLANYGSSIKYIHDERGFNSRLDPIQAAILSVKLKYLDQWNDRRRHIATIYTQNLINVQVPPVPENSNMHAYHLYVVRTNRRNHLQQHLRDLGISTQIHYPLPVHKQRAYSDYSHMSLPNSELLSEEILSLPVGPHLSEDSVYRVVEAVSEFSP